MNAFKDSDNVKITYTGELCKKIAVAIKRSGYLNSIDLTDLVKRKIYEGNNLSFDKKAKLAEDINISNTSNGFECITSSQNKNVSSPVHSLNDEGQDKLKGKVENAEINSEQNNVSNTNDHQKEEVVLSMSDSKSPSTFSKCLLPQPDFVFSQLTHQNTKQILPDPATLSSHQNTKQLLPDPATLSTHQNTKQVLPEPTTLFAKAGSSKSTPSTGFNLFKDRIYKTEAVKDKPKSKLSNLASAILPSPHQVFAKSNLIDALKKKNHSKFVNELKTISNLEKEFTSEDISDLIQKIVENKIFSVIPEFCNIFKGKSIFSEVFANEFVKNSFILMKHKNEFLSCISSMMDQNSEITITAYVNACIAANDWNRMLETVFTNNNDYKLDDEHFRSLMSIFQNYCNRSIYFSQETIGLIIEYIFRYYKSDSEDYMADMWLYCIYHDVLKPESDACREIPNDILNKVVEKLNSKNSSLAFAMKLSSSNWNLLLNDCFCEWLSQLISEKSDVEKNLSTIIEIVTRVEEEQTKSELFNQCLYTCTCVIINLNEKSQHNISFSVFDEFLLKNLEMLKVSLDKRFHKFQYKWALIEMMMSTNKYNEAFSLLKDLEVLDDLEESSSDYNKAKTNLPILLWRVLCTENLIDVINVFEKVVSIFLLGEHVVNSYVKECNQLFDAIAGKVSETGNKTVILRFCNLIESLISSDIKFDLTLESLRSILNTSVESNTEFEDIVDYVDICQQRGLFNLLQNDNNGSAAEIPSNLTTNEIYAAVVWMCRKVKVKLIELAQVDESSIAENLTKICSLTFFIKRTNTGFLKEKMQFQEFVNLFLEILANPRYLSAPLKYSLSKRTAENVTIMCDSRDLYNAIYYSDI